MTVTVHRLRFIRFIDSRYWYSTGKFSSENEPTASVTDDLRPESEKTQSFASYVKEVKANLKKDATQTRTTPFKLSNQSDPTSDPIPTFDELRRNLSGFRRPSSPQPTSSGSGPYVSFQELYKKSLMPNTGQSAAPPSPTAAMPSFDGIRERLRRLRDKNPATVGGDSASGTADPKSFGRFGETLMKPDQTSGPLSFQSSLDKIKKEGKDDDAGYSDESRTVLLRTYGFSELGMELKKLRPDNRKGKWCTLHELNERLAKIKEMEERTTHNLLGGPIKESLEQLRRLDAEKRKKQTLLRLDNLAVIGGTPKYLLSPPQEHLVAKYFHPDHMSSAEKLKLELQKVRDEFKMSESDCGSARVQVAQLTTKIKHLATVLAKKDKHSRKGLQDMVQRRKKLLKYLRRTDWDSYCLVLSKLGLRDNPDLVKA